MRVLRLAPDQPAVYPKELDAVGADNIRAERARHDWRQGDLAERLGWSHNMVSLLEAGKRRLCVTVPKLCRALDITLAELLAGAQPSDLEALGLPGPCAITARPSLTVCRSPRAGRVRFIWWTEVSPIRGAPWTGWGRPWTVVCRGASSWRMHATELVNGA